MNVNSKGEKQKAPCHALSLLVKMDGTREGEREEQRRMNDVRGLALVEVFMRGAGSRKCTGPTDRHCFSFSTGESFFTDQVGTIKVRLKKKVRNIFDLIVWKREDGCRHIYFSHFLLPVTTCSATQ